MTATTLSQDRQTLRAALRAYRDTEKEMKKLDERYTEIEHAMMGVRSVSWDKDRIPNATRNTDHDGRIIDLMAKKDEVLQQMADVRTTRAAALVTIHSPLDLPRRGDGRTYAERVYRFKSLCRAYYPALDTIAEHEDRGQTDPQHMSQSEAVEYLMAKKIVDAVDATFHDVRMGIYHQHIIATETCQYDNTTRTDDLRPVSSADDLWDAYVEYGKISESTAEISESERRRKYKDLQKSLQSLFGDDEYYLWGIEGYDGPTRSYIDGDKITYLVGNTRNLMNIVTA